MSRIYFSEYKGVRAIAVETEALRALFLPDNGAKLASLVTVNGTELLAQAPGAEYLPIGLSDIYVDGECSAFDDMFPTIDPECLPDGRELPDHGEVCRVSFDCEIEETFAVMRYRSDRLDYSCEKRVLPTESGAVEIRYNYTNLSDNELPCLWAGHCMLAAEEGAKILLPPASDGAYRGEISFDGQEKLGVHGDVINVNDNALTSGAPDAGDAYKYYLLTSPGEGDIRYRRGDVTVRMEYDMAILPALGIWMSDGGFKDMHIAALEPCTAPFDRPGAAVARGYRATLPAGETLAFTLRLSAYPDER